MTTGGVEARAGRPVQTTDQNFLRFARTKEYREENRQLLRIAFGYLPTRFFQIDVGSGTGLVSQEMGKLCQRGRKVGTIIGIEPDHFAIENAKAKTPNTPKCTVRFIEGFGQDTEELVKGLIPPEGSDYVSIHDAIHEIPGDDKKEVLGAMTRVLRPEGIFTLNSAFTTKAMGEAAIRYARWRIGAHKRLGIKAEKMSLEVLSAEEYRRMVEQTGLEIVYEEIVKVELSRQALEAIAEYPPFLRNTFPNVDLNEIPLSQQTQALQQSLADNNIELLPRNWYRILARKPLAT